MAETTELNATRKQMTTYNEKLKRDEQQAKYDVRKNELELQKNKRETDFEVEKLKSSLNEQKEKIKNDQEIAKKKQDFEIEFARKGLEMDKLHDEKTIKKYEIDAAERIYTHMNVKEIKINQFGGDTPSSSLTGLIPQLNNRAATAK